MASFRMPGFMGQLTSIHASGGTWMNCSEVRAGTLPSGPGSSRRPRDQAVELTFTFARNEGIQTSGWKSTTQTASRLGSRKFRQKAWCSGCGR